MAEVRCWAIGIDEVREFFAAAPAGRERLLELAEPAYAHPRVAAPLPGLLAKLGPLLRRPPDAPVVTPDTPTPVDAEMLVEGRFVAERRLPAAWVLVRHWLDAMAWEKAHWTLSESDLNTLDFDLARAGVVSQHGVRHLWARDARLILRSQPGTEVGYQRYDNVVRLAEDWARALPQLSGDSARTAGEVVAFVGSLKRFAEAASGTGRPVPDVVTLHTR